jgi:4-amino-4-deoxy-L-arabinose transferase-like glycosyltransferase
MIVALCALAFALRLIPVLANRFHPDEALYATWAMHIASGRDVLLANAPVDKPPLAFYAMALSLSALGRSEIAARLPNLIASTIGVALVWRWAKALAPDGGRGELLAALALSLSPFDVAFGGTAFLDPLMVMWGLAACVASARGRAGWGGVFLGLAAATKAQGALFAPLVLLGIWVHAAEVETRPSALIRATLLRLVAGFACIAAFVGLWSLARGGTPFWAQQTINYGGIRLAFPSELAPRLSGWLTLLPHFFGPIAGLLLLLGSVYLLTRAFVGASRGRRAAVNLFLISYVLGFLGFHWLLAFPVWDRYLLILVPVMAVLSARVVREVYSHSQVAITSRTDRAWLGLLTLAILPFSIQAATGETPIGGDHGAHDGIDRVSSFLRDLPPGTVVYDHWLGWELDFYLWDAGLYRAYFASPADLARDLSAFGRTSSRYIVFPAGESRAKIERAIVAEGFQLIPVLVTMNRAGQTSFVVYTIVPRLVTSPVVSCRMPLCRSRPSLFA